MLRGGRVRGDGGEVWGRGMMGASLPPPVWGGTRESVVQVRDGLGSSVRPGPASYSSPALGGARKVVVQVRGGVSSSRPSRTESFPPPDGGGTEEAVVQVRDGARSSFRLSATLFPPPVEGGTAGGGSDRARAAATGGLRRGSAVILGSVGHPGLPLRSAGGVLRCEPRTCGQAPPGPVELGPGKKVPEFCGLFRPAPGSCAT